MMMLGLIPWINALLRGGFQIFQDSLNILRARLAYEKKILADVFFFRRPVDQSYAWDGVINGNREFTCGKRNSIWI